MQTLLDSGATEEQSLGRIQKLKVILDILEDKHKSYQLVPVQKENKEEDILPKKVLNKKLRTKKKEIEKEEEKVIPKSVEHDQKRVTK